MTSLEAINSALQYLGFDTVPDLSAGNLAFVTAKIAEYEQEDDRIVEPITLAKDVLSKQVLSTKLKVPYTSHSVAGEVYDTEDVQPLVFEGDDDLPGPIPLEGLVILEQSFGSGIGNNKLLTGPKHSFTSIYSVE